MGIVNVIKNIKLIHTEDIVLAHVGKFYYAYGKDAYILSYIFDYRLIQIKDTNVYSCGFPEQSFSKVIAQLENKKINYIVVDRRNNYDVEEKRDNKNLNTYNKILEKAKRYVNLKRRINNIANNLIQRIYEEDIETKIEKVEKIINETRKI